MAIKKLVGGNLNRIRREKRISQEALALAAGIDRSYMSGIERGVRNPTIKLLGRIADELGVTVADLVAPPMPGHPEPKNLNRGRHVKKRTGLRKVPRPKTKKRL